MNILLINHYAGSPEMGMEFRPYYFSKEWIKQGHNVLIVAADYSHLRRRNPVVQNDYDIQIIDGIPYCWIKTGDYDRNGVKRALTMARFVNKVKSHAKRFRASFSPDVIIASSTYPLDTYAAQRVAKICRAKYIHEVHDMWPSTLYEVGGMSKGNPFVRIMQMAEDSAYKHCDKLIALLPYAKDYMVEHGLEPDKFVNIQNGVNEADWNDQSEISIEYKHFFNELKGKFVVGYFGGHALSNSLDILLDVAKVTNDKDIVYVLVGNGQEKTRLMQRRDNEHLDNVFFLDPIKKTEVPDLLNYFDCSYIGGMPSPLYRFGLCINKMYDSMRGGKPIICAIPTKGTLIEDCNCGYMVDPSDINAILDRIMLIKQMPVCERKEMGERGKKLIQKEYTYEKLANKCLGVMEDVLREKP